VLAACRFLFGAGEAGAYPNAARVVRRWLPPAQRSRAQGLITSAAQVGAIFSPSLAAVLIRLIGWRLTFAVFGSVGLVWAAAFYRWYRDDPAEHPGVNAAERELIAGGPAARDEAGGAHLAVPWRRVLASRNVWVLGAIMTCSSFGYYVYITWLPSYLKRARGVGELESGLLASAVLGGSAVGCLAGGALVDWLVRRSGNKRFTLPAVGATAFLCSAYYMILTTQVESVYAATALLGLGCLCAMVQVPAWWAACTEISGKHLGALFGLMNSMGGPGAMLSPWYVGWLVDRLEAEGYTGRAAWDPAFPVIAGVQVAAALLWLAVDVRRSAVDPPAADAP
jgi:MFS family permease